MILSHTLAVEIKRAQNYHRVGRAQFGRFRVQRGRLLRFGGHSAPIFIQSSQLQHGFRVARIGAFLIDGQRLRIPLFRFGLLLRRVHCHCQRVGQVEHGCGVTSRGAFAQPLRGLAKVLHHPAPLSVEDRQIVHGLGTTLLGCLTKTVQGEQVVPRDGVAIQIHGAQASHGLNVAGGGGLGVPLRCLLQVDFAVQSLTASVRQHERGVTCARFGLFAELVPARPLGARVGLGRHGANQNENPCNAHGKCPRRARQSDVRSSNVQGPANRGERGHGGGLHWVKIW